VTIFHKYKLIPKYKEKTDEQIMNNPHIKIISGFMNIVESPQQKEEDLILFRIYFDTEAIEQIPMISIITTRMTSKKIEILSSFIIVDCKVFSSNLYNY